MSPIKSDIIISSNCESVSKALNLNAIKKSTVIDSNMNELNAFGWHLKQVKADRKLPFGQELYGTYGSMAS